MYSDNIVLDKVVQLYKDKKLIFKCGKVSYPEMLNYKLVLPKFAILDTHSGTKMLCYSDLLYYLVRCIADEDESNDYNKLEPYMKNNIESSYITLVHYYPYSDEFSFSELTYSFMFLNNRENVMEFENDYMEEYNRIKEKNNEV